jgi:hypothetical protein
METSEEQFDELLAHLLARGSKMLNSSNEYIPFAMLLNAAKVVEIVMTPEEVHEHSQIMYLFRERLQPKIDSGSYLAVCISYVDQDKKLLVAHLENYENYCLTVTIPLDQGCPTKLMPEKTEFLHKGTIYIFPEFKNH